MLVCRWHDWQLSARTWLPVAYDTQQTVITTSPDAWTADDLDTYIEEYRELMEDLMTVVPRTEATVRLILESGCNLAAIARLRWDDIDVQRRRVTMTGDSSLEFHERFLVSEGLGRLLDALPRDQAPFETSAQELTEELAYLAIFVGCGDMQCADLQLIARSHSSDALISALDDMAHTRSEGHSVH